MEGIVISASLATIQPSSPQPIPAHHHAPQTILATPLTENASNAIATASNALDLQRQTAPAAARRPINYQQITVMLNV